MADILLSYARTDRQRVAPIVALLESNGWSVEWEPADAVEAHEGAHRLGEPACIIAAWSIDSVESEPVWAAASHGLANGTLISLSIDFSRPPQELSAAPSLALAGWTGDASSPRAQELLTAVGELLARAPRATSGRVPEPAPSPPSKVAPPPASEPPEALDQPPSAPEVPEARRSTEAYRDTERPAYRPSVFEPRGEPEPELEPEPEPEPPPPPRRWQPVFPGRHATQEEVEFDLDAPEPPPEPVPALVRRDGAEEPVWAFPEEAAGEEPRTPRLPPVLLRERGIPVVPAEAEVPPPMAGRRGLGWPVIALAAGLAIVAAAGTFWMTIWLAPPSGNEVAAVEPASEPPSKPAPEPVAPQADVAPPAPVRQQETKLPQTKSAAASLPEARSQASTAPAEKAPAEAKPNEAKPQEVQPTPAALPDDKDMVAIEDILGQVTPRVEQLLTNARQLIRIGDIRGARQVLAAPETAQSGTLTFLLAETYDPNVLPAALKGTLADAARARALYRKARELGEGRAQSRLDALKTS